MLKTNKQIMLHCCLNTPECLFISYKTFIILFYLSNHLPPPPQDRRCPVLNQNIQDAPSLSLPWMGQALPCLLALPLLVLLSKMFLLRVFAGLVGSHAQELSGHFYREVFPDHLILPQLYFWYLSMYVYCIHICFLVYNLSSIIRMWSQLHY